MQNVHTILSWFEDKEEELKMMDSLQKNGYHCVSCINKKHFDELIEASTNSLSLIILDLNLKENDAILTCNEIKNNANKNNNPFVIIVSDKTEEYTHVMALDLGADDYIIKPFKPRLFLKRIEAILSRKHVSANHLSNSTKKFFIDTERYVVMIENKAHKLPKKEFELLNLFHSTPNKIFSREEIAILLWKDEKISRQRTIDVHIRNMRRILGNGLIKTVKGFGYGLNV